MILGNYIKKIFQNQKTRFFDNLLKLGSKDRSTLTGILQYDENSSLF